MLSDHYDPRKRALFLSDAVYDQRSVAAVAVAAHEAGHAIQHATSYQPLKWRTAIVPAVSVGSQLGFIVLIADYDGRLVSPGPVLPCLPCPPSSH
ncbi:MAG: zinc metallopeptidase [Thermomicrobiales bacterium]